MSAPVHSTLETSDPQPVHALMREAYADNHLRISGDTSDFRFRRDRFAAQDAVRRSARPPDRH